MLHAELAAKERLRRVLFVVELTYDLSRPLCLMAPKQPPNLPPHHHTCGLQLRPRLVVLRRVQHDFRQKSVFASQKAPFYIAIIYGYSIGYREGTQGF